MKLDGIHHISALTGDALRNVDYYTRVLGLRMTAKSVNQDDPGVYHLFYGEEDARPGSDITFFAHPHAIPGRPGAGMVHRIVWRVASPDALDSWERRLSAEGATVTRADDRIVFDGLERLDHELVVDASGDEPLTAIHPEIPAEYALRGFEGVRAYSHRPDASVELLQQLLGAVRREDGAYELRGGVRGGWIAFDEAPAERGRQSAGSVHHVAWGIEDASEDAWLERLREAGIRSSGVVDRHFFRSIYFREPGGVLYELATAGPSFAIDGGLENLGRELLLPPWLEQDRAAIEARLTPIPDPRRDWPVEAPVRA